MRQVQAVVIGLGVQCWEVLLACQAPAAQRYDTAWTLPGAPMQAGVANPASLARLLTRDLGHRISPAELHRVGWYLDEDDVIRSVFITLLPQTPACPPQSGQHLRWFGLHATLAGGDGITLTPHTHDTLRHASRLMPADGDQFPVIHRAGAEHYAGLMSLVNSSRERTSGVTPALWDADLRDIELSHRQRGGDFLVACFGGVVVGMAGLRQVSRTCAELTWVMVQTRWRNRGVATQLVECVELRATQLGYQRLAVSHSQLHGNGQHFYRRLGYHRLADGDPNQRGLGLAATKLLDADAVGPTVVLPTPREPQQAHLP